MALLALLGACTSSAPRAGAAPTVAAAQQVLGRVATAVRAHDAPALLRELDPSPAARAFRARQSTDLADLAEVPLGAWRYDVVGAVRDRAAIAATSRRYGAPALLLHVTLGYELRGVDRVPSRHAQYLAFVSRDGRTYLAGDDPLVDRGSVSWVGPWRYGPLAVAIGTASVVLGPPADRSRLPALASAVDAAVAAVTRVWGTGWARRVGVLVPSSPTEFEALSGAGIADVSAAAVTDGIDSGTGRPYGQRLVLNAAQLPRLSPTGLGVVLRHEVTHLATAADTADITPRWLVEGFAEYVGNLSSGQSVRTAASELRAAVGHGRVPTALLGDAAFTVTGAALARSYEQAWLACRLVAARAGAAGLVRFYRAVGTALEPRAPAVKHAFATVLHESQATFTRQWRAYLKESLS